MMKDGQVKRHAGRNGKPRSPIFAGARRRGGCALLGGRHGFTLIELLVVVVIVGILATLAMSHLWGIKSRAYMAGMRADLHAASIQQEVYFGSHGTYGATLDDLQMFPSPTDSVAITYAANDGWAAVALNGHVPSARCAVFFGDAPASVASPASDPGEITCTR